MKPGAISRASNKIKLDPLNEIRCSGYKDYVQLWKGEEMKEYWSCDETNFEKVKAKAQIICDLMNQLDQE